MESSKHVRAEEKSVIVLWFTNWGERLYHKDSALTLLQLVLHHHQEGDTYHEEVEAEAYFAELTHGSSAHLPHHILIGLLPADWGGIAEDDQTADKEYQRDLQREEQT